MREHYVHEKIWLSYHVEKLISLENVMVSYTIQMYLREMEDNISLCVSARDHIEPQLPHEEHKVGYVDWPTCTTHTDTHKERQIQVNTESHEMSDYQSNSMVLKLWGTETLQEGHG